MDDDSIDINLRPASEVAARCIILASLMRRLWLESSESTVSDLERAGDAFDLRGWLQAEALSKHLTPEESDWFDRPVGFLDGEALASISTQAEGLATVGWSLGLAAFPPLRDIGTLETILNAVPAPWEPTAAWTAAATLRAENVISVERERAELIAWRTGLESVRRKAPERERSQYDQVVAAVVREAAVAGLAENVLNLDFAVRGVRISDLNRHDLERLSVQTEGRLRTLNWLCGFGAAWDRVPLEV